MSVGAIILIAVSGVLYLTAKNPLVAQWRMFVYTVIVSAFWNVSVAFTFGMSFSYALVLQLLYIVLFFSKTKRVSNKAIGWLVTCFCSIFIGFLLLLLSLNTELIIPLEIWIDDVFYNRAQPVKAVFYSRNIMELLRFSVFCLFVLFSRKFVLDSNWLEKTKKFFIEAFRVFFICAIIEFFVNNFISSSLIRELVIFYFGAPSRGNVGLHQRNGMYIITLFFTEPSYFSVIIAYCMLIAMKAVKTTRDIYWGVISILVLILTGSTMCFVLVPFAVLSMFWSVDFSFKHYQFNKKISFKILAFSLALIFSCVGILWWQFDQIVTIAFSAFEKISAYIDPTLITTYASGSIRNLGNQYCYNAFFHNPLFGYGLGSTRGFGIIPGALATIGLLGCGSYLMFMKKNFNIRFTTSSLVVFCISLVYFTSILTVTYLYEPMILMCVIALNTTKGASTYIVKRKSKRKIKLHLMKLHK